MIRAVDDEIKRLNVDMGDGNEWTVERYQRFVKKWNNAQ